MKQTLLWCCLSSAAACALTRYYWPTVRVETQIVEQEVIKRDVVTVVKEITRPDGTKETATVTTDKSKLNNSVVQQTSAKEPSKWLIGAGASYNFAERANDYSIQVSRRIAGPFWLGVQGTTNGGAGVLLTMEF